MKNKEEKASKFLCKLLNILRSKEHAKIISWDYQNDGIRIHNQQRLQSKILPRFFRHNQISSFVRQLNMYDFHKINLENGVSIFCHSQFNPRDKQSITRIKRKAISSQKSENQDQSQLVEQENHTPIQIHPPIAPKRRRQSFKLLFPKNSLNSLGSLNMVQKQMTTEQIYEEILLQLQSLAILSPNTIKSKIDELKKLKKFRKFLKRGSFLTRIYTKLGIQMDESDKLSQLSIEEQLMYDTNTRKELTLRSLKMFDSGTINLRDTLGMFLNS